MTQTGPTIQTLDPKRQAETKTYFFDLTDLLVQGEVVLASGSSALPSPTDLLVSNPQVNGGLVGVLLSGGTPGTFYTVLGSFVTSLGQRLEPSFIVQVVP